MKLWASFIDNFRLTFNTENPERIVLKRLVKQRKCYLSLTRKSYGKLEIFAENGSFPAKRGGLESQLRKEKRSFFGTGAMLFSQI